MRRLAGLFFWLVVVALIASCSSSSAPDARIVVSTSRSILVLGQTAQLTVIRRYERGPTELVTGRVAYSVSRRDVVDVGRDGAITTIGGLGAVTVTVTDPESEASDAISLVVDASRIEEITVVPSPALVMGPGTTRRFSATARLSDGSEEDVTSQVIWASSNEGVATVGVTPPDVGLASAIAEGDTTISATDSATLVQGRAIVFVRGAAPTLAAITVTPNPGTVAVAGTVSFSATGIATDGTMRDLAKTAVWSSSNLAVATVDAMGVVRGVALGTATITAAVAGPDGAAVKGSGALTVQ